MPDAFFTDVLEDNHEERGTPSKTEEEDSI
jgi:hypothetical protein